MLENTAEYFIFWNFEKNISKHGMKPRNHDNTERLSNLTTLNI